MLQNLNEKRAVNRLPVSRAKTRKAPILFCQIVFSLLYFSLFRNLFLHFITFFLIRYPQMIDVQSSIFIIYSLIRHLFYITIDCSKSYAQFQYQFLLISISDVQNY